MLLASAAGKPARAALSEGAAADSVRVTEEETLPAADQEELKRTLTQIGSSEIAGERTWERHKNPRTALISSALLPGLGQVYNGRRLKVVVMVGFMSFYTGNIILNWRAHKEYEALRDLSPEGSDGFRLANNLSDYYEQTAIDYMWWAGATWLIGVLDAWIDAHLFDIRAYSPETKGTPPPKSGSSDLGIRINGNTRYITLTVGF